MQQSTKERQRATSTLERARSSVVPFEERITRDSGRALDEGSKFFEGTGAVKTTLRKIAKRLNELGIPYAAVGGMALSHHGFPRFTVDVDLLVTEAGLLEIHQRLDGLGYLPPFSRSKNLRDTETGVKIEFLITGQFPGDGKPKPVAFPDPAKVSVEGDGILYVNLPTLLELKIASGMTSTERIKDLGDAQELIKALSLPMDFALQLDPFVRGKFRELWQGARPTEKRYIKFWQTKSPAVTTLEELIESTGEDPVELQAMLADGVFLDPQRAGGDCACLLTLDPNIAKKYDMHDESEYWNRSVSAEP